MGGEPGLAIERGEAGAARLAQEARDPRPREPGQFGEGLLDEIAMRAEQRPHQQGDREAAAAAQMAHEVGDLVVVAQARDGDGGCSAASRAMALGAFETQPMAPGDEGRKRLGRGRDEIATQGVGQRRAQQQGLAQFRILAEAFEDPDHDALAEVGVEIVGQRDHRLALADFRERRGDADPEPRAARERDLGAEVAHRHAIDEIGVGEHRRAREDDDGNIGLVAGQREHDMMRRIGGAREGFGERAAHQRRGIVEQGGQAHRDLAAQRGAEFRVEIGAREGARRFRAARRIGPLRPAEKATHNSRRSRSRHAGMSGVGDHHVQSPLPRQQLNFFALTLKRHGKWALKAAKLRRNRRQFWKYRVASLA